MHDSPRSEAIYAPSIRVSTKPNLTRGTRLRPEREPHVIPIALNLVQRIDIRISELPENQVIGVQLRHGRLNLSQEWYMTRPPALESWSLRDSCTWRNHREFLRTNAERGVEPVRQIHWRAGKFAQSNEHQSLDDLPADGDAAVSVARSSGSIRSLARLS